MKKIFIVAEIGCNHNGNYKMAKRLILEAKKCGVDAVKFQIFKSEDLISKYAKKAAYQIKTTGNKESQLEMTKNLELKHSDYIKLKKYAESLGLIAFATPFDLESINFLKKIKQKIWKIPSGEITNLPYLEKISKIKNIHIILSTGMSNKEEIKKCLNVLHKNRITLLHCNTEYPTKDEDINLNSIQYLIKSFPECDIGFSDHSADILSSIAASSLKISLIEKHFTLNKKLSGPDHKASIEPKELKELVIAVRRVEKMKGKFDKFVTHSEAKNKLIARKSIVAKKNIKKGELFTVDNLTCKRPGNGISPMAWHSILGKTAESNFKKDCLIRHKGFANQK